VFFVYRAFFWRHSAKSLCCGVREKRR
jgi:hypothetical protein